MTHASQQNEIDEIWRRDGDRNGRQLPSPAPLFFRLMGIRLARAAFLETRARHQAARLKAQGIGLGIPNQRELWVIYGVARGWC